MALQIHRKLLAFAVVVLGCAACAGQLPSATSVPGPANSPEHGEASSTDEQSDNQRLPGSISGTVSDPSGAVVAGARVSLTVKNRSGESPSARQEAVSDRDGHYFFESVAPGAFQITITASGFATQTSSGTLRSGENYIVSGAGLTLAAAITDVVVGVTQVEVAEDQMRVEEQQRVLGVLPNFYVSYIPDAAPLNARQKFKLAARTVVDPFTVVFVAGSAGVQQAQNHFRGYGQGAEGYGKRFGAGYADTVSGTFIGGAILPALLRQDPRYFYKGTGSKPSRFLYAIANAVICKGDNKRWQPNYSNILGNLAAGGISNLYYPAQDRDGADLTLENGAIGVASTALANVFQEFIIKKLTPKAPKN